MLLRLDAAWWMLAAMLAFYVQDAARLLHRDEWMLRWDGRQWRAAWPSEQWRWMGRRIWLPPLWRPDWPALRVRWQPAAADRPDGPDGPDLPAAMSAAQQQALQAELNTLRRLRWLIAPLALALLALPLLLRYAPQREAALLACLLLIYALTAAIARSACRHGQRLGLPRAAAWQLAAEYLLCPPLALGAISRLARHVPWHGDALAFAARELPAPRWQALRADLARQVHDELALLPPDSAYLQTLAAWWPRFEACHPTEQAEDEG